MQEEKLKLCIRLNNKETQKTPDGRKYSPNVDDGGAFYFESNKPLKASELMVF